MELIKTSNSISNPVPKIVETPKHFSLNTQLYNKLSFKPYPMKFFTRDIGRLLSLYSSIDRSILLNNYSSVHYYTLESLYNNDHNQINIIQDKTDHDIFYAIRSLSINVDNTIVEKIKYDEITMEYTVLNTVDIGVALSKVRNQVKTLYENDNTLVLFAIGRDASSSSGYSKSMICIIDKKTFTISYSSIIDDYNNFLLESSGDDLYILRQYAYLTTNANLFINKLNINTKANTQIFDYPQTYNLPSKRTMCNPIKIGNDFYMLFTHFEDNAYYYKIMKTSIDTSTDTVSTELLDLDLNGFVLDSTSTLSNGAYLYHTLKKIETENGLYLSLLIHLSVNSTNTSLYPACRHALIKVEDEKFTVISMMQLVDGCFGSLDYIDSKHQILLTSNSILFYAFNETEEKMILTHRQPGIYTQIGLDSLNRIITYNKDGVIEIITEGNSSTLKAEFAEDIYNKDRNNNVETVVEIYAKNFLDEYVDTEVKLTLIGPVVFKENDSQILITSSSNEGTKLIPVIITGLGNIEIIITQNT